MPWKIEFSELADRELSKLDRQQSQRILKFLSERCRETRRSPKHREGTCKVPSLENCGDTEWEIFG